MRGLLLGVEQFGVGTENALGTHELLSKQSGFLRFLAVWLEVAAISALMASGAQGQRYPFRQYDSADGLTNMAVLSVSQDRTGYLWVGTENGLFRYDGNHFLAFNKENGLPDATVRGVAESPDGVLWVATRSGVARRSPNGFQKVDVGINGVFRRIAFDSRGRMYVENVFGIVRGTPQAGGGYRFETVAPGHVLGLAVDGEDVWFSREGDLWHLSGEKAERVGSPAGLPNDRWNSVVVDARGNLWVASLTRLFELPRGRDGFTDRFIDRSAVVPASLDGLYADSHGRVFVLCDKGIVVMDGEERTIIDAPHGLPADIVRSALVDREGSLWIGAEGGGLIRQLGRGQWVSWKREDGLLHNTVWALKRDRAGQVWVGTTGGLSLIGANGSILRSWNKRDGMAADEVQAIAESPAGEIYVASYPAGISRFSERGELLETYRSASVLKVGWIEAMAADEEGRLWTAGPNGCFRSRRPAGAAEPIFDRVEIPGLAADTNFYEVIRGPTGTIWVGTSRGLARYANGRWRIFTDRDGLELTGVSVVAEGAGEVWVGYKDSVGITRLRFEGERTRATHFTKQDGLSSDLAFAFAFDSSGRLWASSDAGINVLDHGRWLHYYREDGLVWNDCDSNSLIAGPQGEVWVGTSAGVSRYLPPRYPLAEAAPAVAITSIEGGTGSGTANGGAANPAQTGYWQATDRPALPFGQRSLLIQFAALSYVSEPRIRFRYRLLGYEPDWSATREHSVRFEGLPAGRYVFQVIASGANGLWSAAPAEFAFSIQPPWWQTWWFVGLCLSGSLLLVAFLWRLRVRALTAQKARLEQLVAERTAELEESHRQLQEIAYCDMLTSLPNRRRLAESLRARIDTAHSQGERFALLLVDLDRFKQVNDTLGHDAGDAVLVEVANRLRAIVRGDDCVARLGGDEFAILLFTADDPAAIEEICTRIVGQVPVSIGHGEQELNVGTSVGVAVFPDDGDDEERLYKAADVALYEAKLIGSRYCFRQQLRIDGPGNSPNR
jgi:diguanylate cyclase (GGDEF)-like protein